MKRRNRIMWDKANILDDIQEVIKCLWCEYDIVPIELIEALTKIQERIEDLEMKNDCDVIIKYSIHNWNDIIDHKHHRYWI